MLVESDFTAGCPVVAAAIGSADDEPQLTTVAGSIFSHWRDALTRRSSATASTSPALHRWPSCASRPSRCSGVVPVHPQCPSRGWRKG